MADVIDAVKTYVLIPVGGQQVKFEKLNSYDRAALLEEYRKALRDKLVANLKECGLAPQERFVELQTFDEKSMTEKDWIEYVNDVRTDLVLLERALQKHHADKAPALAKQSTGEMPEGWTVLKLKAALSGLELVVQGGDGAANPTKAQDGPGPAPGAVYGS